MIVGQVMAHSARMTGGVVGVAIGDHGRHSRRQSFGAPHAAGSP
jgi:hypothetical protein